MCVFLCERERQRRRKGERERQKDENLEEVCNKERHYHRIQKYVRRFVQSNYTENKILSHLLLLLSSHVEINMFGFEKAATNYTVEGIKSVFTVKNYILKKLNSKVFLRKQYLRTSLLSILCTCAYISSELNTFPIKFEGWSCPLKLKSVISWNNSQGGCGKCSRPMLLCFVMNTMHEYKFV